MEGRNIGLLKFSKLLKYRIRDQDYDAVIAITGDEGVGKSSLAWWLAYFTDEDFELRRNCLFNPDVYDLLEMLKAFPRHSCIWMDEAVDLLYKMDFMSKKTRSIIKEFTKDRSMNRVKLIVIPRFVDLTENLRNHRVMYHIHCFERGRAVIFKRARSVSGHDPWGMKDGSKKFRGFRDKKVRKFYKSGEFLYADACKGAYPNNYIGRLEWEKMPEEVWLEYNKLKEEANLNTIQKKQEDKYQRLSKEMKLTGQLIILSRDKWGKSIRNDIAPYVDASPDLLFRRAAKVK